MTAWRAALKAARHDLSSLMPVSFNDRVSLLRLSDFESFVDLTLPLLAASDDRGGVLDGVTALGTVFSV